MRASDCFFYSSQLGDCILTPDSSQLGGNSSQLGENSSQLGEISSQLGEKSSQLGETVHLTINGSKTNMLIQLHAESFADTQFQNRTRCDFKIGPAAISNRPKMNVQIRAEAVFGLTTDNFQMGPSTISKSNRSKFQINVDVNLQIGAFSEMEGGPPPKDFLDQQTPLPTLQRFDIAKD